MKRFLSLIMCILMLISLCACTTEGIDSADPDTGSTGEVSATEIDPDADSDESEPILSSSDESGVSDDDSNTFNGDLRYTVWCDYLSDTTFSFGGESLFIRDYRGNEYIGKYNIEGAIINIILGTEDNCINWRASISNNSMILYDGENGATLGYDAEQTQMLKQRIEIFQKDESYDGGLEGTVWSINSLNMEGVALDSETLLLYNMNGSLSFSADGKYTLELLDAVITGYYEDNGDTIAVYDDEGPLGTFDRSAGIITVVTNSAEDSLVQQFVYNPVLSE